MKLFIQKIIAVVYCIILFAGNFAIVKGQTETSNNVCGDNITWEYDLSTSTLNITGSGDIYDLDQYNLPWEEYKTVIKHINISDNITRIGDYAFYGCSAVESISIPEGVVSIGGASMAGCKNLLM